MAASRAEQRKHWPKGLYAPREGYFVYRSPLSKRNISLGKISEREAIGYATWANSQTAEAETAELVARVRKPHDFVDAKGLLEAQFITDKAMSFDRICGIYFLLLDAEIVYIGKSTSVMTRLANHKFQAEKEFNRVFVLECLPSALDRMERLYISKFSPKYNAARPPIGEKEKVWSESVRSLLGTGIHSMV
jgi:Bacteriophage lambda integrase, Arm DNA-binding domain